MSITPDDWFDRFFGNFPIGKRGRLSYFDDMFGGFDRMRKEMEREFEESFKDLETKATKDLIREYETPEGGKVREIGPFVYGYSMTIGPDGKPTKWESRLYEITYDLFREGATVRRIDNR
jgi:HSP20 family protein